MTPAERLSSRLTERECKGVRLLLVTARDLVSTPKRWTRGALARDSSGRPVPVFSEEAVRFCLAGAVVRAADDVFARDRATADEFSGEGYLDHPFERVGWSYLGMFLAEAKLGASLRDPHETGFLVRPPEGASGEVAARPPEFVSWWHAIERVNDMDGMTHHQILALLDDAIETLNRRPPERGRKENNNES